MSILSLVSFLDDCGSIFERFFVCFSGSSELFVDSTRRYGWVKIKKTGVRDAVGWPTAMYKESEAGGTGVGGVIGVGKLADGC